MTVRPRRLVGLVPLAALILCLLLSSFAIWSQDSPPAGDEPPTQEDSAPAESESPSAPETVQEGLPVELVIDTDKLDDEQQALQSLQVYIQNTQPSGGIPARIGRWASGLFSGQSRPRETTVKQVATLGAQMNGKLVAIEGLYRVDEDGTEFVIAGEHEVEIGQLPQTMVQGFGTDGPNGAPARVEGNVIVQQQGPIIHANQISPGPALTLVRLARCHELSATPVDYEQAVRYYEQVGKGSSATPWAGFAMAHGGDIAAEQLRNAKRSKKLYEQAWDLEGRLKKVSPNLPRTWVQDDSGVWESQTLRKAVGEKLDALNSKGFWYKFVDTFVQICGDNAGLGLILMAIVTRLLLYPLTRKQIQSSRAMQRLQPQVKALQDKHGKDKQKFQEDFWKLCRQNKVNPLGGCLPLLIQMPLLIMVYRGIRAYVVQLADHSFLWIGNLADPNLPLLVLYTISMILFQKLTMKTQPMSDPQQQQQQNMMVWMMPLMFFMFFQSMASGFILYWLGTNLIYLPQQYFGTRLKKQEGEEDEQKERVQTLEPRSSGSSGNGSGGGDAGETSSGLLSRLKDLAGGSKQQDDEGKMPASYEEKKRVEKRKKRRPTRRRKRRP